MPKSSLTNGPRGRSAYSSLWQCSRALEKHQHAGPNEVGVISFKKKMEIKERRHFGHSSLCTWEPRCRHASDYIYFCCQSVGDKNIHRMKGDIVVQLSRKQTSLVMSRMIM